MITEAELILTPSASALEIRMLGSLEVIGPGGTPIAINGQKLRTLLATLALHLGQVVSTDRLIDTIYGDDLPRHAENALQAQISALRRALRMGGVTGPIVSNDGTGYRLHTHGVRVDALRFVELLHRTRELRADGEPAEASRLLHAAIASWRGDALDGLRDCDLINGARLRLEELRLVALEECIECDLALGQYQRWLGDLEKLVRDHPLRERLWAHLMVAQYRAGRQSAALRSFQQARQQLAELGVVPGPELRGIEEAVLAHDPALLAWSGASALTTAADAPHAGVAPHGGRADRHSTTVRNRCHAPRRLPSGFHERWGVHDRLASPHAA